MSLRNIKEVPWPIDMQVDFHGSEAFTNATERWSIYAAPTYTVVASPTSEEDVMKIVKVARAFNIPILATGGRHGYGTTLGKLHGGLAIDLSQMNVIEVDKGAGIVTIGAGTKLGDIITPIEESGFQLHESPPHSPIGSCPSVGAVGVTLRAGIGPFQGLFGLMIDSLISARLVTADGNVFDVSERDNPDLFWAIRGAGANFGIITSATYKLHKAINNAKVVVVDAIYPADAKSAYFDVLQSFEEEMPPELAIATVLSSLHFPKTQILVTFAYSGPEPEARRAIAPFLGLNPPVLRANCVPYSEVQGTILFGAGSAMCVPGSIQDIFSVNVRKFAADTLKSAFDKFDAFYKSNPDGRTSIAVLETFSNQAVAAIPDDATAYPWRDAKGNFMLQMSWPDLGNPVEEVANTLAREVRQDIVTTSGYPDLAVYVNYAHGDETIEQVYGKDKLPKLIQLKKAWDPSHVFKYSNALPMEYP